METIRYGGGRLKQILVMNSYPVGVNFFFNEKDFHHNAEKLSGYRYCQALMKARHGEHVLLDAEGINCPAAIKTKESGSNKQVRSL